MLEILTIYWNTWISKLHVVGLWCEKFEKEETDKCKTLHENSISCNYILTVVKWGVVLIQPRWPT